MLLQCSLIGLLFLAGCGEDGGFGTAVAELAFRGPEFQVNTYTTYGQIRPSVAVSAAGDFVVVWESVGQDGSAYGVFGQRFDNTGGNVGTEFQINTYLTSNQVRASVAVGATGDFVVVWDSEGSSGTDTGNFSRQSIQGRLLCDDANLIGIWRATPDALQLVLSGGIVNSHGGCA